MRANSRSLRCTTVRLLHSSTSLLHPLCLHPLHNTSTRAIEERERGDDHDQAVVIKSAPAGERVLNGEKHERSGHVVEEQKSANGANEIVGLLGESLRRRRCVTRGNIGGRKEERTEIASAQPGKSLYETTKNKCEVVSRGNSVLSNCLVMSASNQEMRVILTQKALVAKVIMLLLKPGFLPFGVTRL